jgi:hypothetical protein
MRTDVETELKSLILDSLEDYGPEEDVNSEQISEELQVSVLKEFGAPQEVARKYNPRINYVIGPSLFEPYLITVAVVLGITLLAHLFGLLSLLSKPAEHLDAIGNAFAGLIQSLQVGLGAITLVFALVERALGSANLEEITEWDPRKLPNIPDHNRFKPSVLIMGTIFLLILLVALNFYPDRIGLSFVRINGEFKMTSWLAPGFYQSYGIWLSAGWFLNILLNIAVLRKGQWNRTTHLMNAGLDFYGAYVFYRIATGPDFIVTAQGNFIGNIPDIPDILNNLIGGGLRGLAGLIAVILLVNAVSTLIQTLRIQPLTFVRQTDN